MTIPKLFIGTFQSAVNFFKNNFFNLNLNNLQKDFPLYWLAPINELGIKLVKTRNAEDTNIIYYPKLSKFLKPVMSLAGLNRHNGKTPYIRVALIGRQYKIEKGRLLLYFANLLNLDYVKVRMIEYDYESLKRSMHITKEPQSSMVRITTPSHYKYYKITPAQLEVLIQNHNIPCVSGSTTDIKSIYGEKVIDYNSIKKSPKHARINK